MAVSFDPAVLRQAFDSSRLVPFIGSGMSRPACTGWGEFVENLERQAGITAGGGPSDRLTERALQALQMLRRRSIHLSKDVRRSVYCGDAPLIPESTQALAAIHWPLVCSTNYDDIYLRARAAVCRGKRTDPDKWPSVRVLGRSDADCRFLLQHLGFPAQQVLWALQGFLAPSTSDAQDILDQGVDALEQELVIGHAEYRKAAHRAPHFRRAFAELFRTRSFLFLGSGLTEAYFRALFDEIVELGGPPLRPHHAFVPEGALDPDFMQREYHILCHCYLAGSHDTVTEWLRELARHLQGSRVRAAGWSFGVHLPRVVDASHLEADFRVIRAGVPHESDVPTDEAVAISCGRGRGGDPERDVPLPSRQGRTMIRLPDKGEYAWHGREVVQWKGLERSFGIVARSMEDRGRSARTPQAIRGSFLEFLDVAQRQGFKAVHVQLLAAGRKRVFAPWVSLVQMARAYGEWCQRPTTSNPPMRVHLYVVDPGVIALLQGGFIDLTEPLENGMLRINVEVFDAAGEGTRHHELVRAEALVGTLKDLQGTAGKPWVHALPKPRRDARPVPCDEAIGMSFRDFGLVSGSTLVIDFRCRAAVLDARQSAVTSEREREAE